MGLSGTLVFRMAEIGCSARRRTALIESMTESMDSISKRGLLINLERLTNADSNAKNDETLSTLYSKSQILVRNHPEGLPAQIGLEMVVMWSIENESLPASSRQSLKD
jgi:hypothetical protein